MKSVSKLICLATFFVLHFLLHTQAYSLGYILHHIPKLIHLATFFTLHSSLFTLIGQLSAGGIDVLATGVADGCGDTRFFEFSFIQL